MVLLRHAAASGGTQSGAWWLWRREQWLRPVLARLLPHTLARLQESWQRQLAPGAGGDGRAAAEADVVQERLLRELTREVCELLTALLEPAAPMAGECGERT